MAEKKIYKRLSRLNVEALKYEELFESDFAAFTIDCIENEKKQLKGILK